MNVAATACSLLPPQDLLFKTTKKRWTAPMQGNLKLNSDPFFIQDTGQSSTGDIIRDHSGAVIFSKADQLPNCADAEEAEVNPLLRCLSRRAEMGIQPAAVETDCAAVCSCVNAGYQDFCRLCFIYSEIDQTRRNEFYFSMSLVKRDTVGVWFRSIPAQIIPSVLSDCNQLQHK